jgi:prefoldin beta subunit
MAEEKEKAKPKKAADMPEDPNAMVAKFQILQQQLQSILMQKETLNINKMEIERAIEELGKTKETTAYKITGNIMVSKPVAELKKDLANTQEAIDIRLKSMEKTEKRMTEQLKDLQAKLQKLIK